MSIKDMRQGKQKPPKQLAAELRDMARRCGGCSAVDAATMLAAAEWLEKTLLVLDLPGGCDFTPKPEMCVMPGKPIQAPDRALVSNGKPRIPYRQGEDDYDTKTASGLLDED